MSNQPGNDDLQQVVVELRTRSEDVATMLDSEKRLVQASRLTEHIIKRYFLREVVEEAGLRMLIRSRKKFLGRKGFENAAFAVRIRNRMSHDSIEGDPTDSEMSKASDVFLKIVKLHIQEIERRAGAPTSKFDSEGQEDQGIADEPQPQIAAEPASKPVEPVPLATKIERDRLPLLDALEKDPTVSASTIAEYDFCPRSGILSHECGISDLEEEMPSTALLSWYEEEAIEVAYAKCINKLFWLLVGLLVGLVVCAMTPIIEQKFFPLLLVVGILVWARYVILEHLNWQMWGKRRLAMRLAVPCDPNPHSHVFQDVNWWGLLRAGYEVRRPEKVLKDAQWKVNGKPRRILQKGSMAIPVHRIRKQSGPLASQHITRVMSHCHLIEATEGAISPFAIVLYGDTYQGTTVPNLRKHRDRFYDALERVRVMIQESDAGERQPSEPATGSICSQCPHGEPRSVFRKDATMRYGEALSPYVLVNSKGKLFHCSCGDRFRWKPPHDRNARLRHLE